MWKLLLSGVALVVSVAFAVPTAAATRSVKVSDNYFVRDRGVPTVTVKHDETVIWRFVGRFPHTVTVRKGPQRFDSKARTTGTYKRRMTKAGSYRIYCKIHGVRDQSMILKVE